MATAYFMQLVIEMTDAVTDQEHIPMIIYNCPQIPDRTGYLLGKSKENPGPQIIACGRKIAEAGAELIAIPCITAHALYLQMELCKPVCFNGNWNARVLRLYFLLKKNRKW